MSQSQTKPQFIAVQEAFAAHLRDPAQHPKPADVEDRRMKIYRDLFYNNMQNFIENGFPVIRQLFNDEKWHRMVRRFFHDHQSHTPYFPEITAEFVTWLEQERMAEADDPAFLTELAQYELAEVIVALDDTEVDFSRINPEGDLLRLQPQVSPWIRLLQYQYPVHEIKPSFQPEVPNAQPVLLLVYRRLDDSVQFMELNPVTARLIQLLQDAEQAYSGEQALAVIAAELGHPNSDVIRQPGLDTLNNLREREILFGTSKAN